MENDLDKRIWFLPHLYWQATKGMLPEEVDNLMQEVERLAEAHDLDALRKYSFICIGKTCHRKADAVPFGAAANKK